MVTFSKVSFVSVIIATSTLRERRVCWNSPSFEASLKAFVDKLFREKGDGEVCALDLVTDVIARGRASGLLAGILFTCRNYSGDWLSVGASAGRRSHICYVWPATRDGGAGGPRMAIPSLLFLARLLPEFPWSTIHASGPEVAATNILMGSVVATFEGDVGSRQAP